MPSAGLPPLRHLFGEAALPLNWMRGRSAAPELAKRWPGDGRPVMVIPGLGNIPSQIALLRRTLTQAGYRDFGWELGHSGPVKPDLFERMDRRMAAIRSEGAGPVTLIGWSLGGVIARDYAHHAPDAVAAVITLGSPFSGDPRSNRAWRIYELLADHSVDKPPVGGNYAIKPRVHTVAIWSDRDGIIPPAAARGETDQADAKVQISCGHFSMSCAPDALEAILRALALSR